jgi:hypothetical protein
MQNSHIIQLLKALSRKEFNKLPEFIASPLCNFSDNKGTHKTLSGKKIISFYCHLKKYYPKFKSSNLNREIVYRIIFPGEKYNDSKFRSIKHELTKVVELYLSFIDFASNRTQTKIHLMQQLKKRRQYKLYEYNIILTEDLINKEHMRDEGYYYQKYIITNLKRLYLENKENLGKSTSTYKMISDEINNITVHFLIIMLQQLSLSYNLKTHLNISLNVEFYEYIYNFFKEYKEIFNSNPVLNILNKFLMLHKSNIDIIQIRNLKTLIDKNENLFQKLDFQYLYIDLLSFCIIQYSKGETNIKDTLIELLKTCAQKEVFVQDGFIHPHNYKNIVSLALRLKDTKLAEEFINNYKDKLTPENRDNAYLYNYASFYYITKKYNKALEILSKVGSMDFYYTTEINNLELRIYYEMNKLESALSLIDSYKHFFSTNKLIPKEYKQKYKNFLKYYEDLVKIKMGNSKKLPGILIKKINDTKEMEFKAWILNKMRELLTKMENG